MKKILYSFVAIGFCVLSLSSCKDNTKETSSNSKPAPAKIVLTEDKIVSIPNFEGNMQGTAFLVNVKDGSDITKYTKEQIKQLFIDNYKPDPNGGVIKLNSTDSIGLVGAAGKFTPSLTIDTINWLDKGIIPINDLFKYVCDLSAQMPGNTVNPKYVENAKMKPATLGKINGNVVDFGLFNDVIFREQVKALIPEAKDTCDMLGTVGREQVGEIKFPIYKAGSNLTNLFVIYGDSSSHMDIYLAHPEGIQVTYHFEGMKIYKVEGSLTVK